MSDKENVVQLLDNVPDYKMATFWLMCKALLQMNKKMIFSAKK